jgi:hypothetical protein
MLKTVLAGTTALMIAGTTFAYAQPGPGKHHRGAHWRPSAQDVAAFGDARIAALKAGLKLTPDQEKNWPAVESALRDLTKLRSERVTARASADRPHDPMQRLSLRGETMANRGTALKKFADAAEPLYQSLDNSQKHRFMVLARVSGIFGRHADRGHHTWRHHKSRGWHHHHRGPEQGAGQPPQPQ